MNNGAANNTEGRADNVEAPRKTGDGFERSKLALSIVGAVTGVAGLSMALVSFEKSRSNAARARSIEIAQHLNEAWYLLGAETGTKYVGSIRKYCSIERQQLEHARREIDFALTLDPHNAKAKRYLGVYFFRVGKKADAIMAYKESLQLEETAEAYSNLGVSLLRDGQPDAAILAHTKAIELDDSYAPGYDNLGNVLRRAGMVKEAVRHHLKAIQCDRGYARAHNNLGLALMDLEKFNEAKTSFQRAVMLRPGYAKANSNLGTALSKLGELKAGIAAFRRAIELQPNESGYYTNVATNLILLGKQDEARWYQERASLASGFAE